MGSILSTFERVSHFIDFFYLFKCYWFEVEMKLLALCLVLCLAYQVSAGKGYGKKGGYGGYGKGWGGGWGGWGMGPMGWGGYGGYGGWGGYGGFGGFPWGWGGYGMGGYGM